MSDGRFDPRAFIAEAPWRFAKSMPHMPHEYVVEGKVPDQDGFQAFVAHIAHHGYRARWRHLPPNSYLELDGWRYWAMPGRGDTSVTIINRERLPGQPLRRVGDPPSPIRSELEAVTERLGLVSGENAYWPPWKRRAHRGTPLAKGRES